MVWCEVEGRGEERGKEGVKGRGGDGGVCVLCVCVYVHVYVCVCLVLCSIVLCCVTCGDVVLCCVVVGWGWVLLCFVVWCVLCVFTLILENLLTSLIAGSALQAECTDTRSSCCLYSILIVFSDFVHEPSTPQITHHTAGTWWP